MNGYQAEFASPFINPADWQVVNPLPGQQEIVHAVQPGVK